MVNVLKFLTLYTVPSLVNTCICLDKSGYQVNIFLIFLHENMLWVLIRITLWRQSFLMSTQNTFLWRNKENIFLHSLFHKQISAFQNGLQYW